MTENCPTCQKPILPNAPGGLCPDCLMKAGLQAIEPGPTVTPLSAKGFQPPLPSALSQQFSQLDVDSLIGHGGMGAVYKAKQIKLNRDVALKVLRPGGNDVEAFAQRFNREAQTLARMNHPNIVSVHDFGELEIINPQGEHETLYYFVMEYVSGSDLRQRMANPTPPAEAVPIIAQVCSALQYAHEQGIIHRDIKPENILIDERSVVKIADFGLAKLSENAEHNLTLTGTHQVMGTPRYMAPEQMESSHRVDHRSDIYSLGVVLYEMLTGRLPMGQFERPSELSTDVSTALDECVLTSLASDPDRRQQSANDMLSQLLEVPTDAAPVVPMGASTILDMGVQKAFAGLKNGLTNKKKDRISILPWLIVMVALAAFGVQIWDFGREFAAVGSKVSPLKGSAAIVLFVASFVLISFGGLSKPSLWRPLFLLPLSIAAFVLNLVCLLQMAADSGDETRFLLVMAILLSLGLLFLVAKDLQSGFVARREDGPPKRAFKRKIPETAHVGFSVSSPVNPGPQIPPHFLMLGYHLANQSEDEWVFERGSNTGHWGMDLRKCFTQVVVRVGKRVDSGYWVSCGWGVRGIITANEIAKLEAEGEGLARAIGGEGVTLTDSKPAAEQSDTAQSLVSVMGGSSRTGFWRPPRHLFVFSLLGGCDVDFRQSPLEDGRTYRVTAISIMAGADIIVPQGVKVEVSGVGLLGGFGQSGGCPNEIRDTAPRIKIGGLGFLGAVDVVTKA